jgi:hypothetical protein
MSTPTIYSPPTACAAGRSAQTIVRFPPRSRRGAMAAPLCSCQFIGLGYFYSSFSPTKHSKNSCKAASDGWPSSLPVRVPVLVHKSVYPVVEMVVGNATRGTSGHKRFRMVVRLSPLAQALFDNLRKGMYNLSKKCFLTGGTGAMAELAWEAHPVAVFPSNQEDDAAAFAQADKQTFDLDQLEVILEWV